MPFGGSEKCLLVALKRAVMELPLVFLSSSTGLLPVSMTLVVMMMLLLVVVGSSLLVLVGACRLWLELSLFRRSSHL